VARREGSRGELGKAEKVTIEGRGITWGVEKKGNQHRINKGKEITRGEGRSKS
jgi:hypothetical protein